MDRQATRLAEYLQERVGEGLRAVGYHNPDDYEVVYIRDDVEAQYPLGRIQRFLRVSKSISHELHNLDEMGLPDASLHTLQEGHIVQIHFAPAEVIFVGLDRDVGRNFTRFIEDCIDQFD